MKPVAFSTINCILSLQLTRKRFPFLLIQLIIFAKPGLVEFCHHGGDYFEITEVIHKVIVALSHFFSHETTIYSCCCHSTEVP